LLKHLLEYISPFKNKRILYSFENKNWHIEDLEKRMKEANERDILAHKRKISDVIFRVITTILTTLRIIKPRTKFGQIRKEYKKKNT